MLQLFQFTPGTPDQPVENETVGYSAENGAVKLPEDTFRLMRLQFFETKHFFAPTILIFAMEFHLYALLCSNCGGRLAITRNMRIFSVNANFSKLHQTFKSSEMTGFRLMLSEPEPEYFDLRPGKVAIGFRHWPRFFLWMLPTTANLGW